MYGILPFILLATPIFIQIIWGTRAILKTTKLKFGYLSLLSVLLQIPLSILSVYIASENINANTEYQNRCGLIMLGIFAANFIISILLLLTIAVQFLIKRYRKKTFRRHAMR